GLNVVFGTERVRMELQDLLREPANYTTYQSLWTLSQDDTERILTRKLAARGVQIERGCAAKDVTMDADGATVTVETADGTTTIRCDWVIACDGGHSAVRKAIGMPFEGATYEDEFIMADAELDWALPDGDMYAFPHRNGFVAAFAMPGTHRFRIFGNAIGKT